MSWGSTSKCCLTCAFWQGNRNQAYRGARWECNSPSDKGQCAQHVFSGSSEGHCACQGTSCSKYVELPK